MHAVAGDHAVRRTLVLDLGHHPLVRLVGQVLALGDQPVQAGALELGEPPPGGLQVVGGRGDVDRRFRVGQALLEPGPALGEGPLGQVLVAERQQVERDEAGRGLLGEQLDPARRRVDALLQGLEVEACCARCRRR